jgi:GNAT superfamily N-acetyltransferase
VKEASALRANAGPLLVDGPEGPPLLRAHLASWLGAWPAVASVDTIGCLARTRPGWDGQNHPVIAVGGPRGLVLSVSDEAVPHVKQAVRGHHPSDDSFLGALTQAAGRPGRPASRLVFRWCTAPAPLQERGTWHAATDSVVPTWLRGFNGEVLLAFDETGLPVSGVGIKKHTPFGQELAVATNPRARGRGLAAALVAQAARRVLEEGSIPLYLHLLGNVASAKTADASGFNDRGWTAFALADPS